MNNGKSKPDDGMSNKRKIIIIIIDRFYIALFSALEQTHSARMSFYMNEYLFIARF